MNTQSTIPSEEAQPAVLLLGMVFTEYLKLISWKNTKLGITTLDRPNRGQEYRDMVRCKGLESLGYDVRTLDNKHSVDRAQENKHCHTSFCDPRRMKQSLFGLWGDKKFDAVILDYFFSPVGWARERWGAIFFSQTLPMLAKDGFMTEKGCIYLPNIQCVEESLESFAEDIEKFYMIEKVSDPNNNPLFKATALKNVLEELLECPDMLTNDTQVRPLNQDFPFYKLTKLPNDANGITPTNRKRTGSSGPVLSRRLILDDSIDEESNIANLDVTSFSPKKSRTSRNKSSSPLKKNMNRKSVRIN